MAKFGGPVIARFLCGSLVVLATTSGSVSFEYIVELKALFHFTHTEAELLSAIFLIGVLFVVLFSPMYSRWGFYGTFACVFVLHECGLLLMGLATHYNKVLGHMTPLIYLFQFMTANGRGYIYAIIRVKSVEDFSKQHQGKALAYTMTCSTLGQLLFSKVYSQWFADVTRTTKYFLFASSVVAVSSVLYVVVTRLSTVKTSIEEECFLEEHPKTASEQTTERFPRKKTPGSQEVADNWGESESSVIGLKDLFLSIKFQLFLWSGTIVIAANYVFYFNIRLYLQSVGKLNIQNLVIAIMISANVVSRILSGIVFDFLKLEYQKLLTAAAISVCTIIAFIVSLTNMDSAVAICLSAGLIGITLGAALITYISFSKVIFGPKNNATVLSILLSSASVLMFLFNLMTGAICDEVSREHAAEVQSATCSGKYGFFWPHVVILCISIMSPLLLTLLIIQYKRKYQNLNSSS